MSEPSSPRTPTLGIRREDKHEWERRVPLTPDAVAELVGAGVEVTVQPSTIRAFDDTAFGEAGARVDEDLSACDVVFAVKEIPISMFRRGGAYVFFSHTIKGQSHNMALLQKMIDLGCTLIDYERIVDDAGKRLVFFGRHAGLAGMVDTLWAVAKRASAAGIATPFDALRLTHEYADLEGVRAAFGDVAEAIARDGVPKSLAPFVIGVAGDGNVSRGAQEIIDLLPVETVEPSALAALVAQPDPPRDRIFKVVFREQDLVEPVDPAASFALQHYYDHPEAYRSRFEAQLKHLTVLVNGIYWTSAYPRLVDKATLQRLFAGASTPRLLVIGDIGCDIDGAVECTVKATTPALPIYVYDPADDSVRDGWDGPGVGMMTTDCLPCELSKEASETFTDALKPFAAAIAKADYTQPLGPDTLPAAISRAVVVWRGELTPDYAYLQSHL